MSMFASFKPNEIANFVRSITKQEIANNEQKFEQVLIGTIKSVDSNKYTVALKDIEGEVEATALNGTDVFSKEDSVYLLKCTFYNNINYLILNTVAVTEEIYFNLPLESRLISSMEIENYSNVETIKANGVLKVEAKFSANGTTENYGLEIKLLDSNSNTLATYYLDINYFEGQPYALNESFQSRVIYIEDKDVLNSLAQIEIKKFPSESSHKVTDIHLYSGTIIEADPSLHAEAAVVGNKNYFNKAIAEQEDNEIVKVSADLYHNSTKLQKSTIQYYWLLKNENIKENIIGENAYLAIVGAGWECLNSFEVLSVLNGGLYRDWNTTLQTLELNSSYRDKLNKFRNILKCLIVYGDNYLYSDKIEILNYEHEEFYANVVKDQESDYLEDSENANIVMTCKVLDRNIENSKIDLASKYTIEYQWYKGEPHYDEDKKLKNDKIENKTKQTLTVYRDNAVIADSVDKDSYIKLDAANSIATFFCEVKIYSNTEKAELLSTEVSNFITIILIIQGNEGKSIKAIKELYLASKEDKDVTTSASGWQEEISQLNPVWGKDAPYLWNYEISYYDEERKEEAYSTDPVIIARYAKDGDPGRGIVSITNYYLKNNDSQNAPNRWEEDGKEKFSTDTEKTILDDWDPMPTPTDSTNKYLWNFEKIEYSSSLKFEYTVPALIGAQGSDGDPGKGIKSQEELYTKSTSSTELSWGENQIVEWYSKEDFFARGDEKPEKNDKGYSLYTGHWDDADDIEDYPYIWKKIRTTYDVDATGTGTNDTADSTPLLLSDLEAATLAAAAQIQNKGDYSSIVGAWCAAVGKTIVDGSTIMSGTVGADQIQVNSLDALTANMGSLTAGEIKSPGYEHDKEGFKISCNDENMIDSKYFAVTKNGEVTAMAGEIAGWDITPQGLSKDDTAKGLKYGLNSDPALVAPSLISEGTSQIIFYCQNNGEMTFQILADGSLYVTAARFSGDKVILNDDVMLADVPASDLLSAAGLLSMD